MLHSPPTLVYKSASSYPCVSRDDSDVANGLVPSRDVSPNQHQTSSFTIQGYTTPISSRSRPLECWSTGGGGGGFAADDHPVQSVVRTSPSASESSSATSGSTSSPSCSDDSTSPPSPPAAGNGGEELPRPPPRLQPSEANISLQKSEAHALAVNESKIAALTALVASQQEQITELLALVRSSTSSSSIAPKTKSRANVEGMSSTSVADRQWRERVEAICCETMSSRLRILDEKIALSVADRIRRVTREHVLSSVDRTIRRVVRDATLDRSDPLALPLQEFKRTALETKYRQQHQDATATSEKSRWASSTASNQEMRKSGQEEVLLQARVNRAKGQATSNASSSDQEDRDSSDDEDVHLGASSVMQEIAARAHLRQDAPVVSNSQKICAQDSNGPPSALLSTVAPRRLEIVPAPKFSSSSASRSLNASTTTSENIAATTETRRGEVKSSRKQVGQQPSEAAGHRGGRQVGSSDVESSIARLKQLVETLELAEVLT